MKIIEGNNYSALAVCNRTDCCHLELESKVKICPQAEATDVSSENDLQVKITMRRKFIQMHASAQKNFLTFGAVSVGCGCSLDYVCTQFHSAWRSRLQNNIIHLSLHIHYVSLREILCILLDSKTKHRHLVKMKSYYHYLFVGMNIMSF